MEINKNEPDEKDDTLLKAFAITHEPVPEPDDTLLKAFAITLVPVPAPVPNVLISGTETKGVLGKFKYPLVKQEFIRRGIEKQEEGYKQSPLGATRTEEEWKAKERYSGHGMMSESAYGITPSATKALTGAIIEQANNKIETESIFNTLNPASRYNFNITNNTLTNKQKWYIK